VSGQRPVTAAVGGAFIVACAATAATAAAVSDRVLTTGGAGGGWDYPPVVWPSLSAVSAAGVVVMTQHRWARGAALLAAVLAAQTAGHGLIAIRSWFAVRDFGGYENLSVTPTTCAAVIASAASGAAVAAVAIVWREPADGWRSVVPARPWYVAAGAAVACLLPQVWNAAGDSGDITGLRNVATLTYSLPWGSGIAAVGWVRGRSAAAAGVTVTVSALLFTVFMVATRMLAYYSTPPMGD
jgi:hypothetical protein